MKPIAPLMMEHRLIERMIALLKKQLVSMEKERKADAALLADAADFFATYADANHHGKEEMILFRELKGKLLSDPHKELLDELISEHAVARKEVKGLSGAVRAYSCGDEKALSAMAGHVRTLLGLYPAHIRKEDKTFFPAAMSYFSGEEQNSMLEAFSDFDRKMIHEKYTKLVERHE